MSNAPPIPPDQRTRVGGAPGQDDASSRLDSAHPDRRDLATGAQSGQPGDSDVNLAAQGRFGNAVQNLARQDR